MEREENIFSTEVPGDPSGYNEADMDLNIEIHAGEWQDLKKLQKQTAPTYSFLSVYKLVSAKLTQLVKEYYILLHQNHQHANTIRTKLQKLRHAQDILLSYVLWEPEKEFNREIFTQEIWDLLE